MNLIPRIGVPGPEKRSRRSKARVVLRAAHHGARHFPGERCKTREVGAMVDAEGFLNGVLEWAREDGNVLAVGLAGSHARGEATDASDIDLVVLLRDPDKYVRDADWTHRFGDVSRQRIEDWGAVTSVRVWYRDGPEVEYGLTDANWAAVPLDEGTHRVVASGLRVLFEREPLLSRSVASARSSLGAVR